MRKYQLIEWKNGTAIERIEPDPRVLLAGRGEPKEKNIERLWRLGLQVGENLWAGEDYPAADGAQIERDDHEREIAEETGQYDPSVGLGRGGTDWE